MYLAMGRLMDVGLLVIHPRVCPGSEIDQDQGTPPNAYDKHNQWLQWPVSEYSDSSHLSSHVLLAVCHNQHALILMNTPQLVHAKIFVCFPSWFNLYKIYLTWITQAGSENSLEFS